MLRYFIVLFFSLILLPAYAQKKNFTIGLQSGNNYSTTIVTNEYDTSPLRGDYFIGSSFGIVARSKFFKYKWEFAKFFNTYQIYAEYGLQGSFGGYNYYYKDQTTFQKQYTFQVPLLLVMRPVFLKYGYEKWEKKKIYPIAKAGFILHTSPAQKITKEYAFGEDVLLEKVAIDNAFNVSFISAFGVQKEFDNGRIMYMGISAQTFFFNRVAGTLEVRSKQLNEIAKVNKGIILWSLDLQYFFGKRVRNPKRGKLPQVIYNPRF